MCEQFKAEGIYVPCLFCPCQGGVLRQINTATSLTKVATVNKLYYDFQKGILEEESRLQLLSTPNTNKFAICNIPKNWPQRLSPIQTQFTVECAEDSSIMNIESKKSSFDIMEIDSDRNSTPFKNDLIAGRMKSSERRVDNHQHNLHSLTENHNVQHQPRYYNYEEKIQEMANPSLNSRVFDNAPRTKDCWAHICCLLFNPNIRITAKTTEIKINDFHVGKISSRICSVCRKKLGIVQRCSAPKCDVYFHAECARRQHYKFSYELEESQFLQIYCPSHSVESPQQNIDARLNEREKECELFFGKIGRWLHEHEPPKPDVPDVPKRVLIQEKVTENEDRRSSAEFVVKSLRNPDKKMLMLFRNAALKRVTLQSVIKLKRVDGATDRFQYVSHRVQPSSLYEMSFTEGSFPWKSFGGHQFKTKFECFERFKKLGELIRHVRANYMTYFDTNNFDSERPIRDIYEAIGEAAYEEIPLAESVSEGMIIELTDDSNETMQEAFKLDKISQPEPKQADLSLFRCNPYLANLQSLVTVDSPAFLEQISHETSDSVGLFNSFWRRYIGKWSSFEGRIALQAELEQWRSSNHLNVSSDRAVILNTAKVEKKHSFDSQSSGQLDTVLT